MFYYGEIFLLKNRCATRKKKRLIVIPHTRGPLRKNRINTEADLNTEEEAPLRKRRTAAAAEEQARREAEMRASAEKRVEEAQSQAAAQAAALAAATQARAVAEAQAAAAEAAAVQAAIARDEQGIPLSGRNKWRFGSLYKILSDEISFLALSNEKLRNILSEFGWVPSVAKRNGKMC